MARHTRDIDRGWKRLRRDVLAMKDDGVKVGIRAGEKNDGVEILDYAMFNEFGTEHIPARPFMRETADRHGEGAMKYARALAGGVILGRYSINTALDALGQWYQARIKGTITQAKSWAAPSSPNTIAQKKKNSTSPLVDSGMMAGAVDFRKDRK